MRGATEKRKTKPSGATPPFVLWSLLLFLMRPLSVGALLVRVYTQPAVKTTESLWIRPMLGNAIACSSGSLTFSGVKSKALLRTQKALQFLRINSHCLLLITMFYSSIAPFFLSFSFNALFFPNCRLLSTASKKKFLSSLCYHFAFESKALCRRRCAANQMVASKLDMQILVVHSQYLSHMSIFMFLFLFFDFRHFLCYTYARLLWVVGECF